MTLANAKANAKQVGGNHYKGTAVEHWDLVISCGLGYLDGVATKYLARWRKSGKGVQDLQKALHYVEKLLENSVLVSTVSRRPRAWVQQEVGKFCRINDITGRERHLFFVLCNWNCDADLQIAKGIISELLAENEPAPPVTEVLGCAARDMSGASLALVPGHVPAEDSNKHAERASGANGMYAGDRVVYMIDGRHGQAGEFLQDGDAYVFFDDGKRETVKWVALKKE